MKVLALLLGLLMLASCSNLVVPGSGGAVGGEDRARAVLQRSAQISGNAWSRYSKVEVGYDGDWTGVVKRLQPDLVDAKFRKSSWESYDLRSKLVKQRHQGPGGTKTVVRRPGKVEVSYEGREAEENAKRAAAALVADAYTAFLFGSSWLLSAGEGLELLESDEFQGETCDLVQGRLTPGFGFSAGDAFVAWIGRDEGLIKRLQFTINGLESTRGADVEVSFFDHWKSDDGVVWPGRFVEWVERPVRVKAHEWRMTGLKVDGRQVR